MLPPLTAFTLYFVGLHGPRHMRALVGDPRRAPGVDTMRRAIRAAMPVFALTLLLGAGLWPLYAAGSSDAASNLLTVTLQMLSALTVPHMLLDRIAGRHENGSRVRPGGRNAAAPVPRARFREVCLRTGPILSEPDRIQK